MDDFPLSYALSNDDWKLLRARGLTWPRPSRETDWQVVLTDRAGKSAMGRTLAEAMDKLGLSLEGPIVRVKRGK